MCTQQGQSSTAQILIFALQNFLLSLVKDLTIWEPGPFWISMLLKLEGLPTKWISFINPDYTPVLDLIISVEMYLNCYLKFELPKSKEFWSNKYA